MGESKEKAALNMAFSQTHLPPESSNPPSPSPTPKQKVLTEQTSKDPTPRSRAVRLVWGEVSNVALPRLETSRWSHHTYFQRLRMDTLLLSSIVVPGRIEDGSARDRQKARLPWTQDCCTTQLCRHLAYQCQ